MKESPAQTTDDKAEMSTKAPASGSTGAARTIGTESTTETTPTNEDKGITMKEGNIRGTSDDNNTKQLNENVLDKPETSEIKKKDDETAENSGVSPPQKVEPSSTKDDETQRISSTTAATISSPAETNKPQQQEEEDEDSIKGEATTTTTTPKPQDDDPGNDQDSQDKPPHGKPLNDEAVVAAAATTTLASPTAGINVEVASTNDTQQQKGKGDESKDNEAIQQSSSVGESKPPPPAFDSTSNKSDNNPTRKPPPPAPPEELSQINNSTTQQQQQPPPAAQPSAPPSSVFPLPASFSGLSIPPSAAAMASSANTATSTTAAADNNNNAAAMMDIDDPFAAIRSARAPLTDLYGPFVADTDTCLSDARHRLQTALAQTLQLRQSFTERVYEKYRVCLIPPEAVLPTTNAAAEVPAVRYQRLYQETATLREEKELEKKQAANLNSDLSASAVSSLFDANTTSIDQLMYYTAGLHLAILPEDTRVDPSWLQAYTQGRGPIDLSTGQRDKHLSNAACTAGESMLDRARKASAMRIERLRRKQLQLLSGEGGVVDSSITAAAPYQPQHFSVPPSTAGAVVGVKGQAAPAGRSRSDSAQPISAKSKTASASAVAASASTKSKASTGKKRSKSIDSKTISSTGKGSGKSRPQTSLSTSTLLSIAPTADQVTIPFDPTTARPCAATCALLSNSKNLTKTTQQRLQHPHRESLGGRRRANDYSASATAAAATEPFLQAYLALTLPPLPAARERLERKPLPVCPPEEAPTNRAKVAVQTVLEQFVTDDGKELRPSTRIQLLNGFRNQQASNTSSGRNKDTKPPPPIAAAAAAAVNADSVNNSANTATEVAAMPTASTAPLAESSQPLDPVIAFSVLQAVGLISQSNSNISDFALPEIEPDCPIWSDKLKQLSKKIADNPTKLTDRTISRSKDSNDNASTKRTSSTEASDNEQEPSAKRPCTANAKNGTRKNEPMGGEPKIPGKNLGSNDNTNEPVDSDNNKNKAPGSATDSSPAAAQCPTTATASAALDSIELGNQRATGKRKYSDPVHPPTSTTQATARRRKYSDPGYTSLATGTGSAPAAGLSAAFPTPMVQASQLAMPSYNQQGSALGALHLANYLRNIRHPAGELAGFMGGLNRTSGYDVSSMLQGARQATTGPPLSSLGLTLQPGAAGLFNYDTARAALYMREQQTAAALLTSAGYSQSGQYPGTAVSALSLTMHPQFAMPAPPPASMTFSSNTSSVPMNPSVAVTENTRISEEGGSISEEGSKAVEKSAPSLNKESGEDLAVKPPEPSILEAKNNPEAETKDPARSNGKNDNNPDTTDSKPESTAEGRGMKFFEPKRPSSIPPNIARLILEGKFDEAVADLSDNASKNVVIEFLLSVGSAVPIPKALVLNPLKEKLNTPGFKNSGSTSTPNVPRDTVAATVLVWLWAHHEDNFQQAFEKSGRTDVDPGCKWLIQAAVDTAVRALTLDIAESLARGEGPFAESSRKGHGGLKAPPSSEAEFTKKLEFHTATVVNKALASEFRIDGRIDRIIPQFQSLVEFLDEARLCALRTKAQERTLLANLMARRATMTESFSHAYTSSTVRAGEALGHDNLFDIVQREDVPVSSMTPHDIISGEDGQWEDPGKPEGGFSPGLAGDDLMRRAHARAMIQKSLRKVQDRNHIRGGTSTYGPYVDPSISKAEGQKSKSKPSGGASPRPSFKRRGSSSLLETQVPAGSGSARAKSWAVYEPNHVSPALNWKPDHSENTPYGLHRVGEMVRSLSASLSARSGEPRSSKKAKKAIAAASAPSSGSMAQKPAGPNELRVPKSTREIDWADIAGIFQSVELPRKSPPTKSGEKGKPARGTSTDGPSSTSAANRTIFAPYCKKIDPDAIVINEEDDASDSEEDVSDEAVLARHQVVLDDMKAKLALFLEARKREQERRKSIKSK